MALQDVQSKDTSLVLSSDAKPRLKWTPELHQRFIDAVAQLGGPEKATPKGLMRVMNIHGLTLYHLKSHLQKYRLGKSQSINENKQEGKLESEIVTDDTKENEISSSLKQRNYFDAEFTEPQCDQGISDGSQNQMNESLQIARALQLQMEVQRKLHQQIEVQRHLQLRIEAQGKYLQSVLKKAQETLAGYGTSSVGVELAKAELSQLVSMVCPSSSLSTITEIEGEISKETERKQLKTGILSSLESSLTSSESSGTKSDTQKMNTSIALSLEMNPRSENGSVNGTKERKRSRSNISEDICVEQSSVKRCTLDLNSKCPNYDSENGPKAIDLNCKEVEQFHY